MRGGGCSDTSSPRLLEATDREALSRRSRGSRIVTSLCRRVHGATGFLMKDVTANPLDYVEGGRLSERRRALSEILDSTNPDLGGFARRGGKLMVAIGTNDTLASPGAQLDSYQAVINKMSRAQVDRFARFYVMPQTGHGLTGTDYGPSGDRERSRPRRCPTPGILLRCCSTGSSMAWRPACRSPYPRGRRACRSVRIRRIRSMSAGPKHRRHRTPALRPEWGTICSSRNRAGAMLRAVPQSVVPLVPGVLEHAGIIRTRAQVERHRPRRGPRRGIGERCLVRHRVLAGVREALHSVNEGVEPRGVVFRLAVSTIRAVPSQGPRDAPISERIDE